jgi:hypothetical protein
VKVAEIYVYVKIVNVFHVNQIFTYMRLKMYAINAVKMVGLFPKKNTVDVVIKTVENAQVLIKMNAPNVI